MDISRSDPRSADEGAGLTLVAWAFQPAWMIWLVVVTWRMQ
jgi:hypothetical protein